MLLVLCLQCFPVQIIQFDLSDSIQRLLKQLAVVGDQVGDEADQHDLNADDQHGRAEYQRLNMTLSIAVKIEVQKSDKERGAEQRQDRADGQEHIEGTIHRIGANDRVHGPLDIIANALEQTGFAQHPVGPDRNVCRCNFSPAGLDDRLQGIREFGHHIEPHRRFARIGAKSAGRIGDIGIRRFVHHPTAEFLEEFLRFRKMRDLVGFPVADHHLRFAFENGLDQLWNIRAAILIVRVRIDNDVGAKPQTCINPRPESRGEPPVSREAHNVVDAAFSRHLNSSIRTAVVDDEIFDDINAFNFLGKVFQRDGQCLLFVQARDLDDKFHIDFPSLWRPIILKLPKPDLLL